MNGSDFVESWLHYKHSISVPENKPVIFVVPFYGKSDYKPRMVADL